MANDVVAASDAGPSTSTGLDATAAQEDMGLTAEPDAGATAADAAQGGQDAAVGDVQANTCQLRCETDSDCRIQGTALDYVCTQHVCAIPCEGDEDCVPVASGWRAFACTTDADCRVGVCVDLGNGTGGCATPPDSAIDCAAFGQKELMVQDLAGNPLQVCGDDGFVCADPGLGVDTCVPRQVIEQPGCLGDATLCGDLLTCGADGRCQCDSTAACIEAGHGDLCTESGHCIDACSDDGDCSGVANPYDGGRVVCAPVLSTSAGASR